MSCRIWFAVNNNDRKKTWHKLKDVAFNDESLVAECGYKHVINEPGGGGVSRIWFLAGPHPWVHIPGFQTPTVRQSDRQRGCSECLRLARLT